MYLRTKYSHPGRITCQFNLQLHFLKKDPPFAKKNCFFKVVVPLMLRLPIKAILFYNWLVAFVPVGMGKECPKAAWVNAIGRHHS